MRGRWQRRNAQALLIGSVALCSPTAIPAVPVVDQDTSQPRDMTSRELACNQGVPDACLDFAEFLQNRGGKGDKLRASGVYRAACLRGSGLGCAIVAAQFSVAQDGRKADLNAAQAYYELGCQRGLELACSRAKELQQRKKK